MAVAFSRSGATRYSPVDVQMVFDAMPTERKDLIQVEDTNRRVEGYYSPGSEDDDRLFERFVCKP